tara:strand:- start:5037 stop:5231 length:195 start_codon:yes stop_codon:yes gene_type:complete
MNKAFKKDAKSWYSSKNYIVWASNPSRKYFEWINAQPNKVKTLIYGASVSVTINTTNAFALNPQ